MTKRENPVKALIAAAYKEADHWDYRRKDETQTLEECEVATTRRDYWQKLARDADVGLSLNDLDELRAEFP